MIALITTSSYSLSFDHTAWIPFASLCSFLSHVLVFLFEEYQGKPSKRIEKQLMMLAGILYWSALCLPYIYCLAPPFSGSPSGVTFQGPTSFHWCTLWVSSASTGLTAVASRFWPGQVMSQWNPNKTDGSTWGASRIPLLFQDLEILLIALLLSKTIANLGKTMWWQGLQKS